MTSPRIPAASPHPRRLTAAGFAILFSASLLAQTAPLPPTPEPPASGAAPADDVVLLSPFQVDTSKDNGYYGANTLSGTRIKSNVQDLGSSITVITKQQLDDTASLDINDIFRYEANTEGTFNFTATSSSTPTSDQIQQDPAGATRIRGISAPNITVDYFTHTRRIPIDTYNIGSAEISRGPNSIIAGIGSPSGTVNTNLDDANLTRSSNRIEFRADTLGGYRSSFNLNRPLVKNRVALRVAAVYADNKYEQKPSYDQVKRIYGALTLKPFPDTTIKFKSEVFHENRQTPNSLTPRDGVTEWLAAGKPTWNPVTYTATINGVPKQIPYSTTENTTLPAGLFANTNSYTRPTMYIDAGQVQWWSVNRLSTSGANPNASIGGNPRMLSSGSAYMRGTVNAATLYTTPGISDRSLYDWTSVNATPTNWNYDHAVMYEAEVQHRVLEHLFFRGAWHLEDSVNYNRNITNPPTLTVDVNEKLLDGRANPFFLRPYITAFEPTIFRSPEYNDAVQASLSYDFDLRRRKGLLSWLGSHVVGLNYENRRVTNGTFRYREAIIDPNHVWLTPGSLNYTNGAAIGRPTYQYYVGPAGALGYTPGYNPPKSGVEGTYNLNYYNAATGQWVSEAAKFGTSPYLSSLGRTQDTAKSVTWQGNMLKDHVVVTAGERRDNYQTRNSRVGATIDGNTGYYSYSTLNDWGPWTYASGPTRFLSGVFYPFNKHWLGLTYSKSSSFQPQSQAVDLFGNLLPNTYGRGHDYGFFVNLFDNKLVASVKFYKQNIMNDRTSNSTIGTRIARIEAGANPFLSGTGSDKMSLWYWASQKINEQMPAASQAQKDAAIAEITQFPVPFQNAMMANYTGAAIRGTADTEGKGAELELTYNPNANWTVKFNGAQTKSVNTRIENNLQEYIDMRMPYWQSVHLGSDYFWTSTTYTTQSAKAYYDSAVTAPLRLDQALLGKSNPQVKKYSWKMLTTYRFTDGWMRGILLGGSARWDDRSVIGYLAGAADSDGIVRTLDVNHGVYDPARYQFDFWTAYSTKLFRNRVNTRFQLNLNNAFEGGGLRATAVNPDGQVYNFRIINPRQLVFTTRFDF